MLHKREKFSLGGSGDVQTAWRPTFGLNGYWPVMSQSHQNGQLQEVRHVWNSGALPNFLLD